MNFLGRAGDAVVNGIVVHELADRSLAGSDARDDGAGVLGDSARCCREFLNGLLSCDDYLVHMLCSFSDRLSRIRDVAFDLADRRVNGRDGFANFGQEIANFERLSAAQRISRRGHARGSDIDQQELVSEQAVR